MKRQAMSACTSILTGSLAQSFWKWWVTQCICSHGGIYRPYWWVQWSHHCSCMWIPVHSPWLPGYIDVTEIVLIILMMTKLFPDRAYICWEKIRIYNIWVWERMCHFGEKNQVNEIKKTPEKIWLPREILILKNYANLNLQEKNH